MIGRFPVARTVFGYDNQILIGHLGERYVVRKKAAVCGEERCVTSLKTAAKETKSLWVGIPFRTEFFFQASISQLLKLCA